MDLKSLTKLSDYAWRLEPRGRMQVAAVVYASRALVLDMDDKVAEQLSNVAGLPGIVGAAYAMPDAHWGYGFPIGGVAAFDPAAGGIVSAGGVGFDIACGVRTLVATLSAEEVRGRAVELADALYAVIPAGVGSRGLLKLSVRELDRALSGGAAWAVKEGFGSASDLEYIEEGGRVAGADPEAVSDFAKKRQLEEVGTLGSGNHYLEVQEVVEIFDAKAAEAYGLVPGGAVVSIHCGSRGLGHQIGTDFLTRMVKAAPSHGLSLPDKELACAPAESELGRTYLGAMRAGINCALANRQVLTQLTRDAFQSIFPASRLRLLFDVAHNTCKEESHEVGGRKLKLLVHRKGATRAFPPGHPELPAAYRAVGQPVIIGGSMGTSSYILAGGADSMRLSFGSSCHGAGRSMSRHQASKTWRGLQIIEELRGRGIIVRSASLRGVAEEAPGAYKDSAAVIEASHHAGLATKVARLSPLICIKG